MGLATSADIVEAKLTKDISVLSAEHDDMYAAINALVSDVEALKEEINQLQEVVLKI